MISEVEEKKRSHIKQTNRPKISRPEECSLSESKKEWESKQRVKQDIM